MWDEQPCMILISVRPLANPSLTSPVPFISSALQGEFWCTASWEWAAPPLWCWRTSWSTATSRSSELCRSWSRRERSTPTGISWLCCLIWISSWRGRRKHARSCDQRATACCREAWGLPGDHSPRSGNLVQYMIVLSAETWTFESIYSWEVSERCINWLYHWIHWRTGAKGHGFQVQWLVIWLVYSLIRLQRVTLNT